MDWVTKKRVQKLLDTTLKDKDFTSAQILALLPKDRHLPTACELSTWLKCVCTKVCPASRSTNKLTVWCSE